MRQVEDLLENADTFGSGRTIDAIGSYGGDERIITSNAIELFLHLSYLLAAET